MISPEAWEEVKNYADGTEVDPAYHPGFMKLLKMNTKKVTSAPPGIPYLREHLPFFAAASAAYLSSKVDEFQRLECTYRQIASSKEGLTIQD